MMNNVSIRMGDDGVTIKIFRGTKDFQGNLFIERKVN